MKEDREGFLMPVIDEESCISCHKCEKTCPVLEPLKVSECTETKVYAGQLKDKADLLEVSSGGAFWAFAQSIIERNGVVYGAAQIDVDHVKHIRVDNIEDAKKLRRSKYLPSDIEGVYACVKEDLQKGLTVLFSGTGCQVAGLLAYLHKDYVNLITCDVVCHGIPSLKVWQAYREEKERKERRKLVEVVFRNKSKGWKENQYMMTFDDGSVEYCPSVQHSYHKGYLNGLFYRKSCVSCPFATLDRPSDITLADYWAYSGFGFDSTNGVSLICTHSKKGEILLNKAARYMDCENTTLEEAISSCRHLTHTPIPHAKRDVFFEMLNQYGYSRACDKCLGEKRNIIMRGLKKIYRKFKK